MFRIDYLIHNYHDSWLFAIQIHLFYGWLVRWHRQNHVVSWREVRTTFQFFMSLAFFLLFGLGCQMCLGEKNIAGYRWVRERPKLLWEAQHIELVHILFTLGKLGPKKFSYVQLNVKNFPGTTLIRLFGFAMSEALQDLRHPPAGKVPRPSSCPFGWWSHRKSWL